MLTFCIIDYGYLDFLEIARTGMVSCFLGPTMSRYSEEVENLLGIPPHSPVKQINIVGD